MNTLRKSLLPALMLCLLAGAAQAQYQGGGGGGGSGGGGGHGHRGGGSPSGGQGGGPSRAEGAPLPKATPVDQVEIVGVVKQIGPEPDRLTIRYEAVEGLNWPAGMKPFEVEKTDLLKGVTVGEKVRFRLESQQIASMAPF